MSAAFDTLSSAIKAIESRANYDSEKVNKAITELRVVVEDLVVYFVERSFCKQRI